MSDLFDNPYKHELVTLKEAASLVSNSLDKEITLNNVAYLLQYGHVTPHGTSRGTRVNKHEVLAYYRNEKRSSEWQIQLDADLNWNLSFDQFRESERTKHVHRLHPYKGKFIPQLVEYFLDTHVDEFKHEVYFNPGNRILDPFCGSGTTLVQANELGIHAVGIDISTFNTLIANVKVQKHDLDELSDILVELTEKLERFRVKDRFTTLDERLNKLLSAFNGEHFPSRTYRAKVRKGNVDELSYSQAKESEFLEIYNKLIQDIGIKIDNRALGGFKDVWLIEPIQQEVEFLAEQIRSFSNCSVIEVLRLVLSRTVRSCRMTTHADLATLKKPVSQPYYCRKHSKICKPLYTVKNWWSRYCEDTVQRLSEFDCIRTDTQQLCVQADSRSCDIATEVAELNDKFGTTIGAQKFDGIFSSPPYVGVIDYHEQHAYSYDIFELERRDNEEIGSMSAGQGKHARESYARSIAQVLLNCKKHLKPNYNVFLVANDKFGLYPSIVEGAGMKLVQEYKRPVLFRVEKSRSKPYQESIFHLKDAGN